MFSRPWAALLLTALVAACYAATLGNGFVFDDRAVLGNHASLSSLKDIPRLLVTPYWSGEGRSNRLYRPLTTLSLALNEALGRGAPWTFHLVNLLLHALVSITLLFLLLRLFGDWALALASAALFAVHPLLSEAVASVVGRAELLAALFVLAAVWVDRQPGQSGGRRPMGASLYPPALFFLALLSKENALAYPALFLLTDGILGRPRGAERKRRAWEFSALLLAAGLYILLRLRVLGTLMEPGSIPEVDNPLAHVAAGTRIVTAFSLTAKYLGLFLFPLRLSADYSSPQLLPASSMLEPGAILGAALVAGLALVAIRSRHRLPPLAWGVGFAAGTFLLVSNFAFPIGTIFAERLFYLPAAGLCTVAGLLASAAWTKRPRVSAAALAGIVALMGLRTWSRSLEWKDDFILFRSASQVSPRSAKVRYNLANAYRRRGDLASAAENYRLCLELDPEFDAAKRNLAVTLTDSGEWEAAVALLHDALEKNPGSGSLQNNLGNAYRVGEKLDLAEAAYRRAMELDPASADPHNNLAAIYQQRGRPEDAEQELRQAIQLSPHPLPFLIHLGDLLLQRRKPEQALEAFSRAKDLDSASPVALRGRGEALLALGRIDQAEAELKASLGLDAQQWEAPALLGFLYQQKGNDPGAERYYLQSLAVHPAQPELRQNLGVLYARQPGGKERAVEQLRLCLALHPEAEMSRRVQAMLEDLAGSGEKP